MIPVLNLEIKDVIIFIWYDSSADTEYSPLIPCNVTILNYTCFRSKTNHRNPEFFIEMVIGYIPQSKQL